MATDVQICSNALMLLGADPIASLSETTKQARLVNNIYAIAKADILRRHPWNCLIKRATLAPRTDTPPHTWSQWFNLPGSCLRLLQVGEDDCPLDYALEQNRILADTDALPIVYLENKAEGYWDANLTNVMVKRMELDLAYPVTKSTSLRDSLKQEFFARGVGVLAVAKAVDGQESQPEQWGVDSPFIAVRGG